VDELFSAFVFNLVYGVLVS